MNTSEMFDALRTAVRATGARVQMIGETLEAPCIVLTPPVLRMNEGEASIGSGRFGIACAVPFGDRTVSESVSLVQKVLSALDSVTEEFTIDGDIVPGTVNANPGTLPAYLIDIEAVLS